jgi:hypothetical protein
MTAAEIIQQTVREFWGEIERLSELRKGAAGE